MAILDQIQTIVVVMLENRSFDNVLGHLSMARFENRKGVEGLTIPKPISTIPISSMGRAINPSSLKTAPCSMTFPITGDWLRHKWPSSIVAIP